MFLGDVGESEWKLLTAEVPDWLSQPVTLVAVHLQDHGDIRQRGITAGTIVVDQIHATVGDEDTTVIVEDFESSVFTWLPIIADPLDPDTLEHFTGGAYRGNGSAKFTFGQHTDHGVPWAVQGSNKAVPAGRSLRTAAEAVRFASRRADHH